MRVTVKNLQEKIKIKPIKVEEIARKISCLARGALRSQSMASEARRRWPAKFNNPDLALYFVKNSVIKGLNRRFFAKDCLTDVISFNLEKDYAEVFIAPCVVKKNAFDFGVSFEEELYRCVAHGILHVLGFNDGSKMEKTKMWKTQEDILSKII